MKKIISIMILILLFGCSKEQKKVVDKTTKDILGISTIEQIEKAKEAVKMAEEVQQQIIDELEEIE